MPTIRVSARMWVSRVTVRVSRIGVGVSAWKPTSPTQYTSTDTDHVTEKEACGCSKKPDCTESRLFT